LLAYTSRNERPSVGRARALLHHFRLGHTSEQGDARGLNGYHY
jgi:hypothetical protein